MKSVELLAIVVVLVFSVETKEFFRYTSVKCGSSLKSVANPYCYIKAYSRKHPLANLGFVLLRTVRNGNLDLTVEHKFKTDDFKSIINYTDYPICETFRSGKANFFIQAFVNTTQQIAGEIIEVCERSGAFKVWNMTFLNTTMIKLWPPGGYRVAYKFTDATDDNIYNFTFEANVAK